MAVCDVLLLTARSPRPMRGENIVWFAVDGFYIKPRTQIEAQSRVLILRRGRRWLDASGAPVSDLKKHVQLLSVLKIRNLSESYPAGVAIPIFVSLGSQASTQDFTDALGKLRLEDICWVGFEELAQPDRVSSGDRFEAIPTLKIC